MAFRLVPRAAAAPPRREVEVEEDDGMSDGEGARAPSALPRVNGQWGEDAETAPDVVFTYRLVPGAPQHTQTHTNTHTNPRTPARATHRRIVKYFTMRRCVV